MEEGDGTENSWRLFTSEKLIGAYRRKDRRREMNKENNTHTSDNGSSSHLSPYTRIGKSKVDISGKGCTLFEDNPNMPEEESNSSDVDEIGLKHPKNSMHNPSQFTPRACNSPLSITNIRSTFLVKRKATAAKSKFKACNSTRKLTEQDFNVNEVGNDDLYDDKIENSRIKDLTDSDVDFDSDVEGSEDFTSDDEEMDIDYDNEYECYTNGNGSQRGKVKSKYQIPEEYASLGGPSAKCLKCNARMWKEERVNKNLTKDFKLEKMKV
ncbi:hypothetical protein POM88_007991 [Heracleum sosnowskyi]|uniref:Uncharacterized protein n=1 Tax=Heracleum sosnowskyi TaxID=360622 RepID=A0AAD8J7T9_9APIA|nr:hypothetical protein POM88_007991 [Heracleum sosnowskyi]